MLISHFMNIVCVIVVQCYTATIHNVSGSTCLEFSCHHCQLIIRLRKEMFHGSAIPFNCEISNTYTCSVSTCGDSKSTTWGRAGKVETRRLSTHRISLCGD